MSRVYLSITNDATTDQFTLDITNLVDKVILESAEAAVEISVKEILKRLSEA